MSRVESFPVKLIRPTKYCLSSSIFTVMSTTFFSGSGFRCVPPVHWKYPRLPYTSRSFSYAFLNFASL